MQIHLMDLKMAKKREVGNTFQNHKMQVLRRVGHEEKTGAEAPLRARGPHSLRAHLIRKSLEITEILFFLQREPK